jgi:hypothetical protein
LDVDYKNLRFDAIKPNRTHGFLRALADSDCQYRVLNTDPTDETQTAEIDDALAAFAPDGIIAGTGVSGLRVLRLLDGNAARARFVSFDDNQWLDYCSVTAIRQNMDLLIDTISDCIVNPSPAPRFAKIPETLVPRKT